LIKLFDSSSSLKRDFFINLIKRTLYTVLPDKDAQTLVIMPDNSFKEIFNRFSNVDFFLLKEISENISFYRQVIIFLCAEEVDSPRDFLLNILKKLNKDTKMILVSVNPESKWKKICDSEKKNFLSRDILLSICRSKLDIIRGALYIDAETKDEGFTFKNDARYRKEGVPAIFFSKWSVEED